MFFIDGAYVSEQEAKISVLDIGLLRGYGVFEYLRTYRGKPFHLWDHLWRLKHSAEALGLTLPYALEEIARIVEQVLSLSRLPEASIKIVVTGGISSDQFTPEHNASLIVFAYPLKTAPARCYEEGVKVITTKHSRSFPTSKSTQYLSAIVALKKESVDQPMEALYVNTQQELLEGTTSNFFGVKGNLLYTCGTEEVLAGITREIIVNLAKPHVEVVFAPVAIQEIGALTEAFISASNKEIMPVIAIDGQQIGSGTVGPVTRRLMEQFRAYTERDCWPPLEIPRHTPEYTLRN